MEAETNVVSSEDQTEDPGKFAVPTNVSTDSTTSPACAASRSSGGARCFSGGASPFSGGARSSTGASPFSGRVSHSSGGASPFSGGASRSSGGASPFSGRASHSTGGASHPVVVPVQGVVPLKMVVLQRKWASKKFLVNHVQLQKK